jgi:hypothetical protein
MADRDHRINEADQREQRLGRAAPVRVSASGAVRRHHRGKQCRSGAALAGALVPAEAMFREFQRLFRLYHGHPPRYLWLASKPYPYRCGYGLVHGERDAAPISACFVDIQMRNRADKKIILVNLRYQRDGNMALDKRTNRPNGSIAPSAIDMA